MRHHLAEIWYHLGRLWDEFIEMFARVASVLMFVGLAIAAPFIVWYWATETALEDLLWMLVAVGGLVAFWGLIFLIASPFLLYDRWKNQ